LREFTGPSAQEALKQANATLVDAQSAYDQAAKLTSTGFATKVTLQDATKALDIARAQQRSAQLTVFTNQPGGSDQVMAQTQLDQATASLAAAQSRLSYTTIKAPRAGTLISRNVELGETVQPPTVLMTLSPAGDTELVVQIDEKNLGLIAIGQKALVSADAYPKLNFPADINYINPGINLQTAAVEVKLKVAAPPAYLTQDMTVSVDIEVARHPGVLIVPAASVRELAGGKPWVLKVAAGRAARQLVKVGLVSAGKAEIVSGLGVGDRIIPATSTVVDGGPLRAQLAAAPKP
jgi:HlyD family secretion protein